MVRTSLARRAASYRYALERLIVTAPSREAADADRLLVDLQAQVTYYRDHTAPAYRRGTSLAYSG
jgi:hypothetical protein